MASSSFLAVQPDVVVPVPDDGQELGRKVDLLAPPSPGSLGWLSR